MLARAALGLAGATVTILPVDRERVALLEEALEGSHVRGARSASRVQSRLAIELAYDSDGGRRDRMSGQAVEDARAAGDPRSIAAALGARHVVEQEEHAGALVWAMNHRLRLGRALLAAGNRDGRALIAAVAADAPALGLSRLAAEADRDAGNGREQGDSATEGKPGAYLRAYSSAAFGSNSKPTNVSSPRISASWPGSMT